MSRRRSVRWVLAGGLLVRLIVAPLPGWRHDVEYYFANWMHAAEEYGVAHVSENADCDYPPGYLYVLRGVALLWHLATGTEVPESGTLAARLLVKLPSVMADLAGAALLYEIGRTRVGDRAAVRVMAAYAFNPAMILNGAVWGQADSLVAVLVLLAAWAVWSGRCAIGFAIASLAVLTKLQTAVVLAPLLLAAWLRYRGDGLRGAYRGAGLAALTILLPFFWAGDVDSVFTTAFAATRRYPFISMNAHNVWWIVGGAGSINISDAMRVGNAVFTYRAVGAIMTFAAIGVILWRTYRALRIDLQPAPLAILDACTLVIVALYLFATQAHERYIVPALILVAATCLWDPRRWAVYVAMSAAVAVSLATTLHASYPENFGRLGVWFPAGRVETYVVAVVFLVTFITLLAWIPDRRFLFGAVLTVGIVTATARAVSTMPLRSSARLSDMEPIASEQGWGVLHRDRSVENHRLSVGGFVFRHGIGTHAKSSLLYHLNGAFRVFEVMYGIDDEANRGQRMRFRLLVDGTVRFDSGVRAGWSAPAYARVSVEGAQTLALVVEDGGDGINWDHADWLEPTLLR